ncbi:MAG: ABC transporter permease [Candidatus Omnitrophica bacterium]|nr:ABC transporter permease [Candidatus Omnitrophota bacterium]
MLRFIIKRLLISIPIIFFLSFITLFLINLVPGNYFDQLRLNPQIGEDVIQQYEAKFHINDNIVIQYFYWLKGVFKLDFGYSFTYHMPVTKLIYSRLFNTFLLSFCAFLLSWLIAIPLGVVAAFMKDSLFDKILRGVAYVFLSLPGFFLALVLMFICAHVTNLPLGGMRSIYFDELSYWGKLIDIAKHMIVPLVVLCTFSISYLFRLMRSNMLDVLNRDFVRILRTWGLPSSLIIFKHVLRNAINPLVTMLGFQLPALFSGAALLEIITGWPGLGAMMLHAVRSQDIFLVMGNMVMVSFLLIVGNIMSDILLAITDPRIRY